MSQNLLSLSFTAADLAAISAAISTLEEKLAALIELSVNEQRNQQDGNKSEAACRQTLIVLAQNQQILPPSFDLAEAERDLAVLDQMRPMLARLRQLVAQAGYRNGARQRRAQRSARRLRVGQGGRQGCGARRLARVDEQPLRSPATK